MKKFVGAVMLLAVVAVCAAPVAAGIAVSITAITDWDNGGQGSGKNSVVGFSFAPAQYLSVTSLGYLQTFSAISHPVTIYENNWTGTGYDMTPANSTEIVSAVCAPGAWGTYTWTAVAPVTLLAGHTYTLAAAVWSPTAGPGPFAYSVNGLNIASDLGMISGSAGQQYVYYVSSDTVAGRLNDNANPGGGGFPVWVGNMEYTVVPEPATMGLLGLGLAGLAMRRNKK